MTNEELKKKIAQIIADYFCPQGSEHKKLWGDDRLCYSKMNFAECEWVTECTDALIAAGIGDVSNIIRLSADNALLDIVIHKAEVRSMEKRVKDAEHRAEVAENELKLYKLAVKIWQERYSDIRCFNFNIALRQAEKELAEERKDE